MFGLNARRLFIIFVVVALVFVAAQYAPAYINKFLLDDFIRQEVKYTATTRKTFDVLRQNIVRKASELDIPIDAKDIRITRRGPSFTLELDYEWPIDLRVYQHKIPFHWSETGESFGN